MCLFSWTNWTKTVRWWLIETNEFKNSSISLVNILEAWLQTKVTLTFWNFLIDDNLNHRWYHRLQMTIIFVLILKMSAITLNYSLETNLKFSWTRLYCLALFKNHRTTVTHDNWLFSHCIEMNPSLQKIIYRSLLPAI